MYSYCSIAVAFKIQIPNGRIILNLNAYVYPRRKKSISQSFINTKLKKNVYVLGTWCFINVVGVYRLVID